MSDLEEGERGTEGVRGVRLRGGREGDRGSERWGWPDVAGAGLRFVSTGLPARLSMVLQLMT